MDYVVLSLLDRYTYETLKVHVNPNIFKTANLMYHMTANLMYHMTANLLYQMTTTGKQLSLMLAKGTRRSRKLN